MAGLNDRGQLLLAGAFVLAVALIGLTLVLTSGGYTTTLASQDNAVERGADAITVRESVVSDLGHHLERANSKYGSLSDRESAFRAVVPAVGSGVRNQSAQRGRLVELSDSGSVATDDGFRIEQTADDDFDRFSAAGALERTLASDVRARNVTFVFSEVPSGSPFTIEFDVSGSADSWFVELIESGSGFDVTVRDSAGSYSQTCTRPGKSDDMTVDISTATVDGRHCPALEAIDTDSRRYDVVFDGNRDDTSGRFRVTVDDLQVSRETTYIAQPNIDPVEVVYSARVPFRYHSASVDYRTDLRIAPGEIR